MAEKLYPFNWSGHAHDIDFRLHRVWLDMRAMEDGEVPYDERWYSRMEKLHEELAELFQAGQNHCRDGRVTWLTGPQIGLAKETVNWAGNKRAESMVAAGRRDRLCYT